MIDRRSFTTAAIGTLVTVGLSAVDAPTAHSRGKRKLTATWWKKRLNRQAELQGDSWHLVDVETVHDASSTEMDQFTVVFRGDAGDPVTEGIYSVKLGKSKIKLLVQSAGNDDSGTYSRATVCRFR